MQNVQVVKTHKAFNKKLSILNNGFTHTVDIPWNKSNAEGPIWNELCANIIEVFGLPGDRYMSHPTPDNMTFYFKSEKDLLLCRVLISDKIWVKIIRNALHLPK